MILVAGCSKSSVQLLKAGDPHVCAANDVTSQLYDIIKQHAYSTDYSKLFPGDYQAKADGWIGKVTFSVDNVTSKEMDAPNERVTCTAMVHMAASGVDKEETASVDYQVVADLSTNKPVVTVDTTASGAPLGRIIDQIAAPEVKKARAAKAAENLAKDNAFEAAWAGSHPDDLARIESSIRAANNGRFTPTDVLAFTHEERLRAECQQAAMGSDERQFICVRLDEVHKANIDNNLCDPWSGSSFLHCNGVGDQVNAPAPVASAGPLTPSQIALTRQVDDLENQCNFGNESGRGLACSNRDAGTQALREQGICWVPAPPSEPPIAHWVHCS